MAWVIQSDAEETRTPLYWELSNVDPRNPEGRPKDVIGRYETEDEAEAAYQTAINILRDDPMMGKLNELVGLQVHPVYPEIPSIHPLSGEQVAEQVKRTLLSLYF